MVIGELLRRTGYVEKTWRLPFGPQKVANIEKLLEQSWDLFARDVYTVPEQVRYLRLLARKPTRRARPSSMRSMPMWSSCAPSTTPRAWSSPWSSWRTPTRGRAHPGRQGALPSRVRPGLPGNGRLRAGQGLDRAEEASEAKRLLYVAVTRAQEEFFWCARTGKAGKDSWWSWFQEHQPHIDQDCYQIIPGELPPLQEGPPQGEPARLELPEYAPCSQYVQVPFSVTALMNYDLCPAITTCATFWACLSGKGPKRRPNPGQLKRHAAGTIVHRVVEQIKDPKELSRLVQDAAAVEGLH